MPPPARGRLDCLIIGGGPAGLTAAIYLSRFRRDIMLVDGGASRAALIPATHNYPGFAGGINGIDLLASLRGQAEDHGAVLEKGQIDTLRRSDDGFVATLHGETVTAANVLLATGIVDEAPALPGLHDIVCRGGIRFCPICDGYEALDKRIGVLGPLAQAARKAIFLRSYSRDVTVLPLGTPDDADEIARLDASGIALIREHVVDIKMHDEMIRADLASGQAIELDVLYPAMGAKVRSELATALGARCNDTGCLYVDAQQQSSVPGLFAAGDVTIDLHQISVATGQAAVAATAVHNVLPSNFR